MKISKNKFFPVVFFCLQFGCSQYQSKALTEQTVQQQLQTPSREQLTIQAAKIKHPLLEPVKFDMADGLSPNEAVILAVLRNPELRAVRDQHAIANAQLLQAGLLPDPQVSYSFSAPSAGTNLGTNNAFGIGLSWQVTALVWRQNKITAAGKQQRASICKSPGRNGKSPRRQNWLLIN